MSYTCWRARCTGTTTTCSSSSLSTCLSSSLFPHHPPILHPHTEVPLHPPRPSHGGGGLLHHGGDGLGQPALVTPLALCLHVDGCLCWKTSQGELDRTRTKPCTNRCTTRCTSSFICSSRKGCCFFWSIRLRSCISSSLLSLIISLFRVLSPLHPIHDCSGLPDHLLGHVEPD